MISKKKREKCLRKRFKSRINKKAAPIRRFRKSQYRNKSRNQSK
jgi:hypothetical protein